MNFKIQNGHSKWILKKIFYVLKKHVPKKLIDSLPKMGFDIPIDDWLRKGLKDFTYYYLSKEKYFKKQLSKLFLCKSNVEITFRRKMNIGGNYGLY